MIYILIIISRQLYPLKGASSRICELMHPICELYNSINHKVLNVGNGRKFRKTAFDSKKEGS